MSVDLPAVVGEIDLAMYELEQPAEPCFVEECETEATWYAVFPHDAPCSVESICHPHAGALSRQITYWLLRGRLTGICRDCRAEVLLASVRFERITR